MNSKQWRLEECYEVGIFNQSYLITEPDEHWPDDPEERKVVCRFPTGIGRFGPNYANARLIAAAPALLNACQSLLQFAERTGWGDLALAGTGNEQQDMISIRTVELCRAALTLALPEVQTQQS